MKFTPTRFPDIILVQPRVFEDERGFFFETYREDRFSQSGIDTNFVQDNHSRSQKGVLRGLHYQIRQAQGKLVRAISGAIFDVAVDIRRSSPTFGQWFGVNLSGENKFQLWIPPGFAHGFYVLSEWAEVTYKTTNYYAPECERTILWNDPQIGIDWPLLGGLQPSISVKDADGNSLTNAELFE